MDPIVIKIIMFILSLSLLIVLHELGHFIPARMFGTRVEKFFLFFDVKFALFKKKIGDTVYGIGWLPLGGYVKISGMIDESMDKEQMQQPPQPWEFRSKPAWQRLIIMLGGVTVNLVLGFAIYMLIMFTWGKTIVKQDDLPYGLTATPVVEALGFQNGDRVLAFDGQPLEDAGDVFRYMLMRSPQTALVEHADGNQETIKIPEDIDTQLFKSGERPFYAYYPSILGVVTEDSPAAVAGLLEGDVIRSVNGYAISSWPEFTRYMESQTKPEISLEIQRADDLMSLDIPVDAEGKIGVGPLPLDITSTKLSYSITESIEEGFWYGYYTLYDYVAQFKFVFTKQGVSQLGGFGTIGSLFPGAWDWQAFWHTTALISIILAFMNVLPIPALDGGHVMFLLYEMITGRKPHDKVLEVAQMIGIILLLGLFIYANANDVMRFLG